MTLTGWWEALVFGFFAGIGVVVGQRVLDFVGGFLGGRKT